MKRLRKLKWLIPRDSNPAQAVNSRPAPPGRVETIEVERTEGVEPSSPAWQAGVVTVGPRALEVFVGL